MCDRFDPPLPQVNAHKGLHYPEGKHKAAWKEICRLPASILQGDYTLKEAWLNGEV